MLRRNPDDLASLLASREAAQPLERIARMARAVAHTQIGYVALVDERQLWFVGPGADQDKNAPRGDTIVDMALRKKDLIWLQDAGREEKLADDPWVKGRKDACFYAAAPILLKDGSRLGAVVVLDRRARRYDGELAEHLKDLATMAAEAWEQLHAAVLPLPTEARHADLILDRLFEDSPVSLMVTDREMRILQTNRLWRETRGVTGDVTGKCFYDLFPDARAKWGHLYDRVLAGEVVKGDRVQISTPYGQSPWVRINMAPWRDASGEIGGLLSMSHNINDLVEALEQVQRSERRLLMATQLGKFRIWEFDHVRNEFTYSGAGISGTERVAGLAPSEIWDAIHPDDRHMAEELWSSHVETGRPVQYEMRLRDVDGSYRWFAGATEAVRDDQGRRVRVVGMLRDIDAEIRAEATLEEALHRAEAANRAKSEFLANMSHEIRTPLNGILGVAGALAKTGLEADQREMVGLVEGSAKTLSRLLSDILDLARIESGRLELKNEAVDIGELCREVTGLFDADARDKGLTISLEVDPAAARPLEGDPTRIRQILSNLLSNAVKFTDAGQIKVAVSAEPCAGASNIKVQVSDTGVGFDAETAARLFNRFEQADGSITRKAQGAGLGLAISRSLAEAMGGALSAASAPGQGSVFTLELTLQKAAAAPVEQSSPAAAMGEELQARVLLAEDHATNRKVVELILQSVGVDLVCVENGAEAVAASAAETFDLILMDMQMPVMDGLTATRAIREREAVTGAKPIPILCLTANALPEHIEASKAAGADSHLTKPISAASLIAAVRETVERGSAPSPVRRSA